jgi:hypothetical protein
MPALCQTLTQFRHSRWRSTTVGSSRTSTDVAPRCRLILQQLARIARVVLVSLRRAQRDQADQLAGADQRNEQVGAALAQPEQARGVEVDVAQHYRRGRLGQVGEQGDRPASTHR